jgi:hypothetical protein
MIVVNAMANALPINGLTTGEVSALYPNLFVPAGFTFSIWGVIYLFLLGYVVLSGIVLWKFEEDEPAFIHVRSVSVPFLISCVLNGVWIFSWHYLQLVFSLIIMLWLLRSLIAIYTKMQKHRSVITGIYFLGLYVPFTIYLAWISVATIANTTALLITVQWNAFGMEHWIWSCIMIVIAFLLTAWFTYIKGELSFGLVMAWALFGIYKGQLANDITVSSAALTASVLSLIFAVIGFVRWTRKTPLEGII